MRVPDFLAVIMSAEMAYTREDVVIEYTLSAFHRFK